MSILDTYPILAFAGMNLLDLGLLLGLLAAAVSGFRRGALSQVAAFTGILVGLLVGAALAPRIARYFVDEPGASLALLTLGLLLAAIFIFHGAGFAIGSRLRHAARNLGAASLDRTAGVAVGLIGVIIAVWLLSASLVQGPFSFIAQQVRSSMLVATISNAMPPAPDLFAQVGNYLDQQGFPQVFTDVGGTTAPPVDAPSDAAVASAQQAGEPSTVQVQATGCGGVSSGSGFVAQSGFVVTNAHVIAGGQDITVRDRGGTHSATAILFDPQLDLAVVSAPDVGAPAIGWVNQPVERNTEGATLGYPGGQRALNVSPAAVRDRGQAVGRDIYGRGVAQREVLTLGAEVRRGDSGGPFVTSDGQVGGVVFAAAQAEPGTAYALTAERVAPDVANAVGRNTPVDTGPCRF